MKPCTVNDNRQDDQSLTHDIYARITAKIVAALEDGVRPWVKLWNTEHAAGPALHRHQHSVAVGVGQRAGLRRTDLDDLSDARQKPDKPVRKCYARIREVRNEGALWRFGRELHDKAAQEDKPLKTLFWDIASGPPTHLD